MRFFSLGVAVLAAVNGAMAAAEKKDILVSFDAGVPAEVVDHAIEACKKAGGKIVHTFNLIPYVACLGIGLLREESS